MTLNYSYETETITTVESEQEEIEMEVYDVEQKQRNEGIEKLVERDVELKKLFRGEIKHKARPMRKKAAKQAFENYMKLYFDSSKKVTVSAKNNIKRRLKVYVLTIEIPFH